MHWPFYALATQLRGLGCSVKLEVSIPETAMRQADVFVEGLYRAPAVDMSVVHPLAPSASLLTVAVGGAAACQIRMMSQFADKAVGWKLMPVCG